MLPERLRDRKHFLILTSVVMAFSFAGWMALLNNFVIEKAGFGGVEIGYLQSLREVPGLLAFTSVFLLLAMAEQRLAMLSLALLTLGVALTGYFPFEYGLYATTVIMSTGFHYFESVNQSLQLQYLTKDEAPSVLGQIISIKSAASLIAYAVVWLAFDMLGWDYQWTYVLFGGLSFALLLVVMASFPQFESHTQQHKKLILRKKYWLYYLLTFFSGARRQIFVVFAGFMMVEKFGYDVADIAALYILNHVLNLYFGKKIGRIIGKIGERRALTLEYGGLIFVFVGYAVVENAHIAAGLYVIDHLFFAMAIALKTFFQKIADPADMAGSAGVSFSINHVAAVVLPAVLGLIWVVNPAAVFYFGAALAVASLVLSQLVGRQLQQSTPELERA